MTAILWAAAIAGTPIALIFAWIKADEWLDGRWADEAPETAETTPEWLAVLAATDTPIFAEVWAESLRRDLEELA